MTNTIPSALQKIIRSASHAAKSGTVEQMRIKRIAMQDMVNMFTTLKPATAEKAQSALAVALAAAEVLLDLDASIARSLPSNVTTAFFPCAA